MNVHVSEPIDIANSVDADADADANADADADANANAANTNENKDEPILELKPPDSEPDPTENVEKKEEEKDEDDGTGVTEDGLFLKSPRLYTIENVGNSCYINSTLQLLQGCDMLSCLFLTERFRPLVKLNRLHNIMIERKKEEKKTGKKKKTTLTIKDINRAINDTLCVMYHDFLDSLITKPGVTKCKPHKYKDKMEKKIELIKGFNQHDVPEFLTFFLNQLDDEMKLKSKIEENTLIPENRVKTYKKYKNLLESLSKVRDVKEKEDEQKAIINKLISMKNKYPKDLIYLFEFAAYWDDFVQGSSSGEANYSPLTNMLKYKVFTEITCMTCNNYYVRFSVGLLMHIPVKKVNEYVKVEDMIKKEFFDSVEKMQLSEDSSNNNPYRCDFCGKKTSAQKITRLWDLPERLIIQLKLYDFKYDKQRQDYVSTKIDTPILYPKILDLNPYISKHNTKKKDCQYRLCGFIRHYGGLQGGHYTAASVNFDGEYYYLNDDEKPGHIVTDTITKDEPYILLYERVETSAFRDIVKAEEAKQAQLEKEEEIEKALVQTAEATDKPEPEPTPDTSSSTDVPEMVSELAATREVGNLSGEVDDE